MSRKQKGLSQFKLATELGMAITFINDIENCKKWVSPETLARLASFFSVPVAEFFTAMEAQTDINPRLFAQTLTEDLHRVIDDTCRTFNV